MSIIIGTLADDTLNGTSCNDLIIGDQVFLANPPLATAVIFGSDTINGNGGNDIIYGDTVSTTFTAYSTVLVYDVSNYNIEYGSDTINGNDGNDWLVGDSKDFIVSAIGGNASATADADGVFVDPSALMGLNTLDGGSGNDVLIGNFENMVLSVKGGISTATHSAEAWIIRGFFVNYQAILNGGDGNDLLIGGAKNLTFDAKGGDASQGGFARAVIDASTIALSDNILAGGSGNDRLIGSVETFSIKVAGGKADQGGNASAFFDGPSLLDLLSNTLDGDSGNDVLIGSIATLSIDLAGGKAAHGGDASAFFTGNKFRLGDNTLNGGDGNDVLIGTLQNLNISMKDGSVGSGGGDASVVMGSELQFYGNTLIGGAGNDTLYATMVDMSQLAPLLIKDENHFTLITPRGENVLRGGTGNDTLYGGLGITYADFSDATSGVNIDLRNSVQNVSAVGLGKDTLININGVIGTKYADTLTGNSQNNFFRGGDGNDTVNGMGGYDVLSFRDVTQATDNSAHGSVVIPAAFFDTYHALQAVYGTSFLPNASLPPSSIVIDGVWIDPSDFGAGVHSVTHGTTTTTFQSIEGFEGTWGFSNYIATNEYYLLHPDATAAEAGANAPTLIAGATSSVPPFSTTAENVLIGGSGNDVILGGRSAFNYLVGGAGDDLIQVGEGLNEGLRAPTAQYPFGTPQDSTPNNTIPLFNLVYGGEGNDTVYCYCSGQGLLLTYLGAGDDTFNDFCPSCVIVTYGGDGNDTFNIGCGVNLKHTFGDAGNDTVYLLHNRANDITDGGSGNDQLLNWLSNGTAGDSVKGHFTGGTGDDTFGISMAHDSTNHLIVNGGASVGSLTITDFHQVAGNNDILEFKVGASDTLAKLNADAVFSHVNVGGGAASDTVVTFNNGSTLTLWDADISSFSAANTVLVH